MKKSRAEDRVVEDEAVRWNLQHGVECPFGEVSFIFRVSPRARQLEAWNRGKR